MCLFLLLFTLLAKEIPACMGSINHLSQLINARDLSNIPMCLLLLELWISCHQCEISLCSLANGFCFTPCTTIPNSVEYVLLWLMVLYCWKTTRKSWVPFFFFLMLIFNFLNWTWWGLCGFLLVVFYLAIFSPLYLYGAIFHILAEKSYLTSVQFFT